MDQNYTTDSGTNPLIVGDPWKESLCGCFDDMGICCCGCWCLPCLFGKNAENIDGSNCVGMCILYYLLGSCSLCWIPHWEKRKILRRRYRLQEEPCHDCLVTAFCGGCAICQEARELKAREASQIGPNVMPIRHQPYVA